MSSPNADEILRARRKLVALERTRFRLQQAFDRIDHEIDVVKPLIKQLEEDASNGVLPEFTAGDGDA